MVDSKSAGSKNRNVATSKKVSTIGKNQGPQDSIFDKANGHARCHAVPHLTAHAPVPRLDREMTSATITSGWWPE